MIHSTSCIILKTKIIIEKIKIEYFGSLSITKKTKIFFDRKKSVPAVLIKDFFYLVLRSKIFLIFSFVKAYLE